MLTFPWCYKMSSRKWCTPWILYQLLGTANLFGIIHHFIANLRQSQRFKRRTQNMTFYQILWYHNGHYEILYDYEVITNRLVYAPITHRFERNCITNILPREYWERSILGFLYRLNRAKWEIVLGLNCIELNLT